MNAELNTRLRRALRSLQHATEPMTPAAQRFFWTQIAEHFEAIQRGDIRPTRLQEHEWMDSVWRHADILDSCQA